MVELATGADLLTLTPEEGSRIFEWYWGMPASGKAIYATAPVGAVSERPAHQAVWRIVDLDTGDTTIIDERLRAEWEWVWWLKDSWWSNPSPRTQCFYRHQDMDTCLDLIDASQESLQFIYRDQERQERNTSIGQTQHLGFIWLD